jgi:predicted NAD/FAD-binding protein
VQKAAIIGTGIAGMASAHFLRDRYDLTLYERNDYVGGHTNTVTVDEGGREVPIDAGFMVYNEVTYPNLTELFRELGVPTMPTSMSFSVQHRPSGLEWCGTGIRGLFAQKRNVFRPEFYRFLGEVNRFNKEAVEVLDEPGTGEVSLAEFAAREGYSAEFLERYLIPMSSAVWSTEPGRMLDFPAATLVRFFLNHGFLGLNTQHQWRTVVGGSRSYRDRLIAPFRDGIHVGRAAARVTRVGTTVMVTDRSGHSEPYDAVVLACHADEALGLLDAPTSAEAGLLGKFRYQENVATLHTDASVMPRAKRAWSSWNYRVERRNGELLPSTVYYMNSLQKVSDRKDYFISIGDPGAVDPGAVLKTIVYTHPLFTVETARAQRDLPSLNAGGPVYFCGSYFRYGFHEDALNSAIDLSRVLLGERVS